MKTHAALAAAVIAAAATILLLPFAAAPGPALAADEPSDIEAADSPALDEEQRRINLESFDMVWTTVRDRHYDPNFGGLDWDAVREELRPRVERATTMDEARAPMQEMLERMGQSHMAIFPSEVLELMAAPREEGSTLGVTGIDLRVIDGLALVTKVSPGSPAAKAGVKTGWSIVKAGDEEIESIIETVSEKLDGDRYLEYALNKAAGSQLLGPIGEAGPFHFLDGEGEVREVEIGFVEEEGFRSDMGHLQGLYVTVDARKIEDGIGYLALSMFMNPNDVMPAINEAVPGFEDAPGVVVDIRGNPGGIIAMGMGLAGWFVSEKNHYLGKMILRETELKAVVFPRPNAYTGPVAILVDGLSGSTSEIFAGGMQDLGRAKVFGSRTAGAALPSEIIKLPNGDGFQYVFADYISQGGEHLEGKGVVPDVKVSPTREALLQGRDSALEAALDWIREQSRPAAKEAVGG